MRPTTPIRRVLPRLVLIAGLAVAVGAHDERADRNKPLNAEADTLRMNHELQAVINTMPEQYYWVHKRFKDRPPGEADFYR